LVKVSYPHTSKWIGSVVHLSADERTPINGNIGAWKGTNSNVTVPSGFTEIVESFGKESSVEHNALLQSANLLRGQSTGDKRGLLLLTQNMSNMLTVL